MTTDFLVGAHWSCTPTDAGTVTHPRDLAAGQPWFEAQVPGTVSSALRAAGESVPDVDAFDWWFVTTITVEAGTPLVLELEGLATSTTVWVDGVHVATSDSMFMPLLVDIVPAQETINIALRFDSMTRLLSRRMPRGRWRSSMISQQGLRHVRTTWLGRAPVYGRLDPVVGPWRPVRLHLRGALTSVATKAVLDGSTGVVVVTAHASRPGLVVDVSIGDTRREFVSDGTEFREVVEIPEVEKWWPHTHGDPTMHDLVVVVDGETVHRTRVGFRRVEALREAGGFAVHVNGVPMFCRGVCWTPPDPVRMWAEPRVLRTALARIRDAGLNMVRVVGGVAYEQQEFWSDCADAGIMVWQDVMLATVDPPSDDAFVSALDAELTALFRSVASNPALTVVSGGSETLQQPTLLGIAEDRRYMEIIDVAIPDVVRRELQGVPYVTSSPSSEAPALHTHSNAGVAHYFGVGGYLRPLSDVRSADVRFAAECLAFSVPPERKVVDRYFGSANVAGHHPDWKAAIPRDRGSSWDFEDVRDHYVRTLFGVDPHLVRRSDPERYLDFGRAAISEAVTECFGYWRSNRSRNSGALVLTGRDLEAGAGWGLLDVDGQPKAPWFALARVSSPVAVLIRDDGLDGLVIEVVNDGGTEIDGVLALDVHTESGVSETTAVIDVAVPAHGSRVLSADVVLGGFNDVNHAYGFGGRLYDAMVAELSDRSGTVLADSTFILGGPERPLQHDVGLSATAQRDPTGGWSVEVKSRLTAQYVCVELGSGEPADSWFHLAAGQRKVVGVIGGDTDAPPRGSIRALNSTKRAQIG